MYTFIRGSTARLWFRIQNPLTGEYYDPDTSVTAAVYNSAGADVMTGQSLTKYSTGIHYYDYDTTLDETDGVYTAVCTGVDTSNGTNMDSDVFAVKAVP